MRRALLLAALLSVLPLPSVVLAQANAIPEAPHILVYGSAVGRAVPDRFEVTVLVEYVDPSADVARKQAAALFDAVLEGMRGAGAPDRGIEATHLEIGTQHRFNESTRRQEYEGIRVSRKLTARFDSTEKLSRFLAGLDTSQHVQVERTGTSLSTEPQLRAELRRKAIEDSVAKARLLAEAYGVALGPLYSVSDVAPEFSYGVHEGQWQSLYHWSRDGGGKYALDRITVTGSRLEPSRFESFAAGELSIEERLYAVFRLGDAVPAD